MRRVFFGALIAALAFVAGPGRAADLPRRSAPPPDYYSPTPAYNWQGFYLGAQAGGGFASFTDDYGRTPLGSVTAGVLGVTGGYNATPLPNLLIGLEADFLFTGIRTSNWTFPALASSGSQNDIMTVRGRAGYLIDRALIYLTGGFAGSLNSVAMGDYWTRFYGQQTTFQAGWTVGAGLEFMLFGNVSAKGEYLFTSVGSDRYFDFSPYALQNGLNTSLVKAGLNYHF